MRIFSKLQCTLTASVATVAVGVAFAVIPAPVLAQDAFVEEAEALKDKTKTSKPVKKAKRKAPPKRKRFAQKRRVTLPKFRPGTSVENTGVASNADAQQEQVTPKPSEPKKEAVAQVVVPKKADAPVVAEAPKQPAPKPEMKPEGKVVSDTKAKPKVSFKVPKAPEEIEVPKAAPTPKPEIKVATAEMPKVEAPKAEVPKIEPTKIETPKATTEKAEMKVEPAKPAPEQPVKAEPVVTKPEAPKAAEKPSEITKIEVQAPASENGKEPKPQELALNDNSSETTAETKVETPAAPAATEATTPTFESANVTPIVLGERPKKFVKALRDKRLKRLPGPKARGWKLPEVIALRHYALGLLNSDECKSIKGGGRSAGTRGMLFVVCTEDPTFVRQFPLEEESW